MRALLSDLFRHSGRTLTLLVMDEEGLAQPRPYRLRPRILLWWWGGSAAALTVLVGALVLLTPLRTWIPGYDTEAMRTSARLNSLRLAAMQDSLALQQQYMLQLQSLVLGRVDSAMMVAGPAPEPAFSVSGALAEVTAEPWSANWADHVQPALSMARMPVDGSTTIRVVSAGDKYLSSLHFPALPPVDGYFTRGFDARTGHYAIDVAVEEGSMVHVVGDGHVIFADWTHDGGYTITVQHADGYVSVYKHNQRLLKRVGDRVYDREAIAISGNAGEITTGPHLHFELWHNGLAQDPRLYFIGL